MSEIRVRRSGLITFAIRLGSTLTGLVFVVLVTSNLNPADFGLWQLISRVIGYVIFVENILNFWTIRYRARGTIIGKTVMLGSAFFGIALSIVYILVSFGVARSVTGTGSFGSNIYYFLISTPEIPLYVFSGVLESILWGSVPERASFGFGVFEVSKVVIGGVLVGVFRLSLTGAILAVIGAQIVQLAMVLIMTHNEFSDKLSLQTLKRMIKTGWIALLNQLTPLITSFDFLIVAVITSSTIPLAFYGVAFTYGTIVTYSGWIAYGLYAGILSGIDPKKSTRDVLELQYLFIIPMVIGEIALRTRLLHLFNPVYTVAWPILVVLAVASAFSALSQTFDNVVTAVDTTDASSTTDFSAYFKSKLFLVAKINILLSAAYLLSISLISVLIGGDSSTIFGSKSFIFVGFLWAASGLAMWTVAVGVKLKYVRQIASLSLAPRTIASLLLGAIGYTIALYFTNDLIPIKGGEVIQALLILAIGAISISVYAGIILAISDKFRDLTRYALKSITS